MTKRVKRHEGYYSMVSKTRLEKERVEALELCNQCGKKAICKTSAAIQQGVTLDSPFLMTLRGCEEFEHKIKFRNPIGFRDRFNTIRLGDANEKFIVGNSISLCDLDGNVIARAEIMKIVVGPKDDILLAHSKRNHGMKKSRGTRAECAAAMLKQMSRHYHSRLWERTEHLSAVYMRVLKSPKF